MLPKDYIMILWFRDDSEVWNLDFCTDLANGLIKSYDLKIFVLFLQNMFYLIFISLIIAAVIGKQQYDIVIR